MDNGKYYTLKVSGSDTTDNLAETLRLIASALDGKGDNPKQSIEDIDGADWSNCTVTTEIYISK